MNIQKLIIEDVRCFAGRQEFNIRPITFLVGENSTGKSTVLGCLQTLADFITGRRFGLDFNVEPYQMGAFADIVRKAKPGKKSFQLGVEFQVGGTQETNKYFLTLQEKEKGSEPIVQEQRMVVAGGELVVKEKDYEPALSDKSVDSRSNDRIVEIFPKEGKKQRFDLRGDKYPNPVGFEFWWWRLLDRKNVSAKDREFYDCVEKFGLHFLQNSQICTFDVYSFAPLRSKPQRTYNPLKEDVSPEGSDMPMLLMNMSKADKDKWQELKNRLVTFGKASGLFTDIDVRKLGQSMGDPFQLQVRVQGPKANLVDVGYGVNQLLPILVRIFNALGRMTFLMQQPEVHLHPKGQAELSSLLIDIVKQRGHKFVIETHSDYMINRARIEIMKGTIKPEDVSLIYLASEGNRVRPYNIQFDKQANVSGAPSGYREFFLKEADALLGLGED